MRIIEGGALSGERYRVIVSTDIGGSDPDDFQSMVHYLLYADMFDTEGLISSPWDKGTVHDIFTVIDRYEQDYERLRAASDFYPTPDELRAITKQGETRIAPYKGFRQATEGSNWIIECAHKPDPRPLYILVWGLLEDVAQALHDDPTIKDKLRINYIAGPNKKWGLNAYEYVRKHFPDVWMIENNSTYRGWFVGGKQAEDLGNQSFVREHIAGHGALGSYFAEHLNGTIKMGDTPSVAYLLRGTPEVPESPSWGGSFVQVSKRPQAVFHGQTSKRDMIEVFGVLELVFAGPDLGEAHDEAVFWLHVEGQQFEGFYCGKGEYKVRFMPKSVGNWSYFTSSSIKALDGLEGQFTSVEETEAGRTSEIAVAEMTANEAAVPVSRYPRWWSDRLEPELAEGAHKGAVTVNKWREAYLRDFQHRMDRCLEGKN